MDSARSYLKTLYGHFHLLGAWPPNQRVEIGEVGVLEDGIFRRVTTLAHLGIPFQAISVRQPSSFECSIEAEVSVGTEVGAKAALVQGAPAADLRVRFRHAGGFLFAATGVVAWRVEDTLGIEQGALALRKAGEWDPAWVVVSGVFQADALTVLLGEEEGAELGLRGSAALRAERFSLGDAHLGLEIAEKRGQTLQFLAEVGMTPLYQALRLERHLVQRDRLRDAPLVFGEDDAVTERLVEVSLE